MWALGSRKWVGVPVYVSQKHDQNILLKKQASIPLSMPGLATWMKIDPPKMARDHYSRKKVLSRSHTSYSLSSAMGWWCFFLSCIRIVHHCVFYCTSEYYPPRLYDPWVHVKGCRDAQACCTWSQTVFCFSKKKKNVKMKRKWKTIGQNLRRY